MSAFNPSLKDLKSNLNNMLLQGINSFEDGFEILDIDLEIDEHLTLDVLAKDAKGNPTVILMADTGEENLIHHILDTLCHLRKHRFLLQRIYKDHAFDFSVPPRILLLSSRFSDGFIEKLDFIVAGDIVPFEYFSFKADDKEFLTFTRRDIEESGDLRAFQVGKMKWPSEELESLPEQPDPTPAPATQSKPAVTTSKVNKPFVGEGKNKKGSDSIQSEKFYHEAKKKILRISNDIAETIDEPFARFKIDNQILVTLSKGKTGFFVYLGDTDKKSIKISSEDQLNEALNLIFKRYFTVFSSISK